MAIPVEMVTETSTPPPSAIPDSGDVSTAIANLRGQSRSLFHDRSQQLHAMELRLVEQLACLMAELASSPTPPTVPPAALPPPLEADPEEGNAPADSAGNPEIARLQAEIQYLRNLRRESEQALEEARILITEIDGERQNLLQRMQQLESQTDGSSTAACPADAAEEIDRLQGRLELAIAEIRELKGENEKLRTQGARRAAPASAENNSGSFDWETQKQRLLQRLETDFDSPEPAVVAEKLQIEEVIQATDQAMAEKDLEIEELRERLADQAERLMQYTEHPPAPVEDRTAVDAALNADEAVQAERQRLHQLQEEWREKLRKSEVEISIERAKLARERLQLEEKLRLLPTGAAAGSESGKRPEDPKNQPQRGRWLTRLGLGNNNEPT